MFRLDASRCEPARTTELLPGCSARPPSAPTAAASAHGARKSPIASWLATLPSVVLRLLLWTVSVAMVGLVVLAAAQPWMVTLPLALVLMMGALIGFLIARRERQVDPAAPDEACRPPGR